MIRSTLAAAVLLAAGSLPAVAADTYVVDPNHSQVRFEYSHFGLSTIVGLFTGITGELVYDAADPSKSSVKVSLPIQEIHTGVSDFNDHLRSADFFDVAKFPAATFTSTAVESVGANKLKVTGDLTVRDITRSVVLDVTLNGQKNHPMSGRAAIGFDATGLVKRTELGVGKYAPNVGDDVKLSITVEASVPKA